MARTAEELRSIFNGRTELFRELAIYESIPPVSSTVVDQAISAITNIPETVAEISSNQYSKDKIKDQVSAILSAENGAAVTGRLIVWPRPWPLPWPPIWLGRESVVQDDELDFAAEYLATRAEVDGSSKNFGGRAAFFLAMGAGVLVGRAIAQILRSSDEDEQPDTKIAFATDYISQVGFATVQTAAMSRPDYINGVDICAPALNSALEDSETAAFIDEISKSVESRTSRVAPAIGFAIGVLLGYLAEAN